MPTPRGGGIAFVGAFFVALGVAAAIMPGAHSGRSPLRKGSVRPIATVARRCCGRCTWRRNQRALRRSTGRSFPRRLLVRSFPRIRRSPAESGSALGKRHAQRHRGYGDHQFLQFHGWSGRTRGGQLGDSTCILRELSRTARLVAAGRRPRGVPAVELATCEDLHGRLRQHGPRRSSCPCAASSPKRAKHVVGRRRHSPDSRRCGFHSHPTHLQTGKCLRRPQIARLSAAQSIGLVTRSCVHALLGRYAGDRATGRDAKLRTSAYPEATHALSRMPRSLSIAWNLGRL